MSFARAPLTRSVAAAGLVAAGSSCCWLLLRRRSTRLIPALRLTYLDIKGKAEPIRLALSIGQIPFEDRRVSYDEIRAMRAEGRLPFGQVPVLEIDGGPAHGQSLAILHWAGKQAGLYPSHLQLAIDGALLCMEDIQAALLPVFYRNALPRSPRTGQLYEATALTEAQRASEASGGDGARGSGAGRSAQQRRRSRKRRP